MVSQIPGNFLIPRLNLFLGFTWNTFEAKKPASLAKFPYTFDFWVICAIWEDPIKVNNSIHLQAAKTGWPVQSSTLYLVRKHTVDIQVYTNTYTNKTNAHLILCLFMTMAELDFV